MLRNTTQHFIIISRLGIVLNTDKAGIYKKLDTRQAVKDSLFMVGRPAEWHLT